MFILFGIIKSVSEGFYAVRNIHHLSERRKKVKTETFHMQGTIGLTYVLFMALSAKNVFTKNCSSVFIGKKLERRGTTVKFCLTNTLVIMKPLASWCIKNLW